MIKITRAVQQKTQAFLSAEGQTAINYLRQELTKSPTLKESAEHHFVWSDGYKQGYLDALRDLDRKIAADAPDAPRSANRGDELPE